MRIAIPTVEGQLAIHFGHCRQFAIIDAEDGSEMNVEYVDAPPHQPGLLPRWLGEKGVDLVITGGMGSRAQQLFASAGVKVIVGALSEAPGKVVEDYLAGRLTTGDNVCSH